MNNGGMYFSSQSGSYSFDNGAYLYSSGTGSSMHIESASTGFVLLRAGSSGGLEVRNNIIYHWTPISSASDSKLKENIKETEIVALNLINKLEVVEFDWKDEMYFTNSDKSKHEKAGFTAQQVKDVIPELVNYDGDKDIYGINSIGLIPYLTKAIQEQQKIIETQNTRITALETAVQKLTSKQGAELQ